jgi:hypothetical protein
VYLTAHDGVYFSFEIGDKLSLVLLNVSMNKIIIHNTYQTTSFNCMQITLFYQLFSQNSSKYTWWCKQYESTRVKVIWHRYWNQGNIQWCGNVRWAIKLECRWKWHYYCIPDIPIIWWPEIYGIPSIPKLAKAYVDLEYCDTLSVACIGLRQNISFRDRKVLVLFQVDVKTYAHLPNICQICYM